MIRSTATRSLGVAAWLAVAIGCVPGTALGQSPSNELGRVIVLAYHRIGEPEGRWTRTPAGFRRDLERLKGQGYRLVALNDVIDGVIDLPAGTNYQSRRFSCQASPLHNVTRGVRSGLRLFRTTRMLFPTLPSWQAVAISTG